MTASHLRIRTNALWNVGALIAGIVLNFVSIPIILGYMGAERYGVLALLLSFLGPLALLDFGMSDATLKHLSEQYGRGDRRQAERYAQSAFVFNLTVGVLGGAAMVLIGPFVLTKIFTIPTAFASEAGQAVRLLGVVWMLTQVRQTFVSVLMAARRYDLSAGLGVATQAILLGASIAALSRDGSLFDFVAAQAVVSVLVLGPWFYAAQRVAPDLRLRPIAHYESLIRTGRFGFWQMLNTLGAVLSAQAQRWVLGLHLPVASVGYFNLALQLANLPYYPGSRIAQVFFPELSAMQGRGQERESALLMLRTTWLLGLVTMAFYVPLVVFAQDLLGLWVGREIAVQTASLLRVLCAASAIGCLFLVPNYFLLSTGRVWWLGVLSVVQGVITFCGSLLFVPLLGLPGAGLGMLLGTGILVAAMLLMWWTAFRAILGWAAYCSAIFLPYGLAAVIAILGLWARGWGPEWFTWGPLIIIAAGLAAVTIGLTAWIDRRLPGGHERGIYLRTVIGQTLLCPLAKIRSRLRLRL